MRKLFVGLGLAAVLGCGAGEAVAPAPYAAIAGAYSQALFNGDPMPYGDPTGQQVLGCTLDLSASGAYTETTTTRNNIDRSSQTLHGSGTFTSDGHNITTRSAPTGNAADWIGTVSGKTLTLQVHSTMGAVYVFVRP